MALAHVEFDATDESGSLLSNVQARVELEGGGLVSIYSDRAGSTAYSNPQTFADGKISFYVAGGAYKITLTAGAFSRVLRYKANGLLAENDALTAAAVAFTPAAGLLSTNVQDAIEEAAGMGGGLPISGGDMTGPIGFDGPSAVLNDPSAVAGSAEEFFYPDFFGNPANGIVHRLNRLLVGIAALTSSDTPPDTQDWLETLVGSTTRGAQLAAISAIGNLGVLGAARTSDFRAWAGAASGGAQGVTGFGWNDDTVAGTPIAVGGEFRAFRKTGVVGITAGAQISAANEGTTVDITPSGGVVAGSTMALLLTNGPAPTDYDNPISAALVIGSGALSAVSRKGLIFLVDALDTSLGGGAAGIAIEMARSQSVRWLNSSDAVDAEIWGNANGLNISGTVRVGASLANYYTISGSASTQPVITVEGSSTDIDLVLTPKGVGVNMLRKTDAQTTAVAIAAQLRHSLSSGTAGAGIGVGQNFVIVNASSVNKIIAIQEAVTTDATNGSEDADYVVRLMAAGAAAAEKFRVSSVGKATVQGGVVSVDPVNGNGYATGAGGAVTQATSKSTGVTLNKVCGQITTHNAALAAATEVSFTVTNSAVAATDVVAASIASGGTASAYAVGVTATSAGSFVITITNLSGGSLSEALVLNFAVIKAVAA
jgi:hypothetical protein